VTIAVKDTCPRGDSQVNTASQRCEVEITTAIVDRVTFNAHILETGTQSYRLRTSKTTRRTKTA